MKRKSLILLAACSLFFLSCNGATVRVTNPLGIARVAESVEIPWSDLVTKLGPELTPDNILVTDPDGDPITSQVLYRGGETPQSLLFQVDVNPKSTVRYGVKIRPNNMQLEPPMVMAHGRFVPERMDDFAWENNLIAHRMYGPALEATGELSNGIDVWLKHTSEMIIDKWYTTPGYNYHRDNGDGLDSYKVGRTLGAGAMAPYEGRQLWLGKNFTTYQVLDNGPLRISFALDYAPFLVDTVWVTERRVISLDANTPFNRITETYTGAFQQMSVAAGVILRGPKGKVLDILNKPISMVGYWEPQNTDNGDNNGHTGIGLVFTGEVTIETRLGHLLASTTLTQGQPLTYLMGATWSKRNEMTSEKWTQTIFEESTKLHHPLTVKIN